MSNIYKLFYSEIVPKLLKNNSSLQLGFFSSEPKVSVAGLIGDEVVSVEDEASAKETAGKSDKYVQYIIRLMSN